jgi:hypothetical protein
VDRGRRFFTDCYIFSHDYRGASSRIDTEFTKEMYTFWRKNAVALRNETGASQTFAIQHVGANLIQQGIDKGGNPLGIEAGSQQCQYSHAFDNRNIV